MIFLTKKIASRRKLQLLLSFFLLLLTSAFEICHFFAFTAFLDYLASTPSESIFEKYGLSELSSMPTFYLITTFLLLTSFGVTATRTLSYYSTNKISALIGSDMASQLYRNVIYTPYELKLKQNTSYAVNLLSRNVSNSVIYILSFFQVINNIFLFAIISISLCFVDIYAIAILIPGIALAYLLIYNTSRGIFKKNSRDISHLSHQLIKLVKESINSSKEIILGNLYNDFLDIFDSVEKPLRRKQTKNNFLVIYPKQAIEGVGIALIVILSIYYHSTNNGSGKDTIVAIGIVAFAFQRLLPVAQQIFLNYSQMKIYSKDYSNVISNLKDSSQVIQNSNEQLNFEKILEFRNLNFKYPNSSIKVINNTSLTIHKTQVVALIGSSGKGKSTLLDVMMGLLKPESGEVLIDEVNIFNANNLILLKKWYNTFWHVPQNGFLMEGTIAQNISLKLKDDKINFSAVNFAVHHSELQDLVDSMPYGVNTKLSENAKELSGGQKQRIFLARALYCNKEILFLDEATSALDSKTEAKIYRNLRSLKKTVVTITHTLNKDIHYDNIVELL